MTQGNSQVILLTVSEFAKICQTTPRTIRFYEKKGVIKPVKIDKFNDYRYYSPTQVRDIHKIKLLQKFDIPLREIRDLIKMRKDKVSLEDKLTKLDLELKKRQKELNFLKEINSLIFDNLSFEKEVKEEIVGPFNLFCFYVEKGNYYQITDYINELVKQAKHLGIRLGDKEIAFYHDFEYKPKNTKLEVGILCKSIPDNISLPEHFSFKKFPATRALIFTFKGPYSFISLAHKKFDEVVEKKKIKLKGPVFEYYIKTPLHSKSPYGYITKIGYPV